MVIAVPLWGEVVEETPPVRRNRHLVSECFTEPRVGSPHKYTPEAEARKTSTMTEARKTPPTDQVENISADEQEPLIS